MAATSLRRPLPDAGSSSGTSKPSSRSDGRADRVPARWKKLTEDYPALVEAYDRLSDASRNAGPLDESAIALVKLSVSVGCGSHRTVHAHAKKALRAGAHPESLRQVALIALPTIGLPAALDALQWIDESIEEMSSTADSRAR